MTHALATPRRVRRNRHRWRKAASGRQHYNYFRDYDPSTGRYLQSDPIGLGGGMSTYGYVGGRPFELFDRLGLDAERILFNPYRQDLQYSDAHMRAENRLLHSAQAYNSPEGVFTIAGHGAPGRVRDDSYRAITPQQLWDMIKDEYEEGGYKSIRLAVCDAGRDDENGFNYAREFARVSGQSVEASQHYVGYPRNGQIFLGSPVPNSATPKVVPNPALKWTTFP